MKTKTGLPAEAGQTTALNTINTQQYRTIGFKEIVWNKLIELEKQVNNINKKLDEILGEEE